MKHIFGVVDEIRSIEGNLHDSIVLAVMTEKEGRRDVTLYDIEVDLDALGLETTPPPLFVKRCNFYLGELIIMQGQHERDYLGDRKPSKWDVHLSFFENIEEAIEYSIRIYNKARD